MLENELTMKVIISEYDQKYINSFGENGIIMFGGEMKNPEWEEYLNDYIEDELHPHFEMMKKWLIKQTVIPCAMSEIVTDNFKDHFGNSCHFEFSDGKLIAFSFRGWGDFAQAVVGKREGYMAYYDDMEQRSVLEELIDVKLVTKNVTNVKMLPILKKET